jgi:hypothetical protein
MQERVMAPEAQAQLVLDPGRGPIILAVTPGSRAIAVIAP